MIWQLQPNCIAPYDREGHETELTFPDGQSFWTARDGLGRATEGYQGPLGSTATIMTAYAYDAAARRQVFARRFGDRTVYGYDPAGRLASVQESFAAGIGNSQSAFTYNPAGQLRTETRTNDAYAWKDSVAASRNYATNGQNQYTGTVSDGTTSATFTYDANGNLTSDGTTTFAYDAENRLLSASGKKNATLSYDPLGRLFQIHSTATGTTQFLYDGDELIAEYNASGAMLRRYLHGDSDDDPQYWYEGAGLDQPRFPHANHQGSITATAGPGATPLWINTYDEYGIPGDNKGRFQYTGQAWLPELGMYHYKARIYSPTLGRFLQTDPIGYDDQTNLYGYTANDPVNRLDPDGRQSEDVMDRRNQGFVTALNECDGGCLKTYGDAIIVGGSIALDIANTPASPGPDVTIVIVGTREVAQRPSLITRVWRSITGKKTNVLPKPPSGKGSVPRSERDPKRSFSPSERAVKRAEQGNKCGNGCGTKIDETNSEGHHMERHADGGRTISSNHAEVCKKCHAELHRPE